MYRHKIALPDRKEVATKYYLLTHELCNELHKSTIFGDTLFQRQYAFRQSVHHLGSAEPIFLGPQRMKMIISPPQTKGLISFLCCISALYFSQIYKT